MKIQNVNLIRFKPLNLMNRVVVTRMVDVVCRYKRSNLKARQLGDLEFTSRQAELLKSKAKLSSLCSFLRRMQNSKKR